MKATNLRLCEVDSDGKLTFKYHNAEDKDIIVRVYSSFIYDGTKPLAVLNFHNTPPLAVGTQ